MKDSYYSLSGHLVRDVVVREPWTPRVRRITLSAAYEPEPPPTVEFTEQWEGSGRPPRTTVLTRAGSMDGLPFYEEWEVVTDAPRAGDVWLCGDGLRQPWAPGTRGAPAGKWHPEADRLIRQLRTQGDPAIYATPEMAAARQAPGASVCADPHCGLSGYYAHVGMCAPCECGMSHARAECPLTVEARRQS